MFYRSIPSRPRPAALVLSLVAAVFCLAPINAEAQPDERAAPLSIPRNVSTARLTPAMVTMARLKTVGGAVDQYREAIGGWPDDLRELIDMGFLEDPIDLIDARMAARRYARAPQNLERIDTFRITDAWREGAIVTTDLPRDGRWIVLTGRGEVYEQRVDPAWLGTYHTRDLSNEQKDRFLDRPAAQLGAYLSDATTTAGRRGVGVDAIIPGYTRSNRVIGNIGNDLRPGDVIVTCAGQRVQTIDQLEAIIARRGMPHDPFKKPMLEVIRDQRLIGVLPLKHAEDLPLDADPSPRATARMARHFQGSKTPGDMNAKGDWKQGSDAGVTLNMVGAHADDYFKHGDVILEIDGVKVSDKLDHIGREKHAGDKVQVRFRRGETERVIDYPFAPMNEYLHQRALTQIALGQLDEQAIRSIHRGEPDRMNVAGWTMLLEHRDGLEAGLAYTRTALRTPTAYQAEGSVRRRIENARIDLLERHGRREQAIAFIESIRVPGLDAERAAELETKRFLLLINSDRGEQVLAVLRSRPFGPGGVTMQQTEEVIFAFADRGAFDPALAIIEALRARGHERIVQGQIRLDDMREKLLAQQRYAEEVKRSLGLDR